MKWAVLVFPGSNCDYDCYKAAVAASGEKNVDLVWHQQSSLDSYDVIIVPGGFSYGDYLRAGAIAHFAPVMSALKVEADKGKPVIGICNGFQILLESGLLPGALQRNKGLRFLCHPVNLAVTSTRTPFTAKSNKRDVLTMPIAHGEGNYYADADNIKALQDNDQIVFQYADFDGNITAAANPNGSLLNIAGICNKKGNVVGMMPHPERAAEKALGSDDGRVLFESVLETCLSPTS